MIVETPKTGEIDQKLWIALEDLQDRWKQSGEVGQEVFGAGIAFGIIPKQFHKINRQTFLVFCEYALFQKKQNRNSLTFITGGDPRLSCRIRIILDQKSEHLNFTLTLNNSQKKIISEKIDNKTLEFIINGSTEASIAWK